MKQKITYVAFVLMLVVAFTAVANYNNRTPIASAGGGQVEFNDQGGGGTYPTPTPCAVGAPTQAAMVQSGAAVVTGYWPYYVPTNTPTNTPTDTPTPTNTATPKMFSLGDRKSTRLNSSH